MAYEYSPFDSEEERKRKEQEQATSETVIGGSGGIISGSSSVNQSNPNKNRSGSWTNLNSYLDANKDQAFGNKVAGKVEEEIDQAQNVQSTVNNEYRNRVDSNKINFDENLVNEATSKSTDFIKDDNKVQNFYKQRDAEYKGPKNLNDTQDLYDQVQTSTNKAKEASEASKTEDGRFSLLDRYFNRSDYNQGMKSLDNLIVQNDDNARQRFGEVQAKGTQVVNNLADSQNQLNQYSQDAQRVTDATRAQTRSNIGIDAAGNYNNSGAIKSRLGDIDQSVELARGARDTEFDNYKKLLTPYADINSKTTGGGRSGVPEETINYNVKSVAPLTKEQFDYLGINPDAPNSGFFGLLDPSSYLSKGVDPTKDNAATPEQVAQLAALSKLAGIEQNFVDPNQAGTYDKKALFNAAQFKSEADAQRAVNAEKYAPELLAYMNAINSGSGYAPIISAGKNLSKKQAGLGEWNWLQLKK